jgi:hypothetical protein
MMGLPLAFTAPVALIGLIALPVIWLLIRITPPRPERVPFPPIRILASLRPQDETPARTPWWLLALRLLLAAIAILAMAGPLWNPPPRVGDGTAPYVLIVDDSWAAAPSFERRIAYAIGAIEAAGRRGEPTALVVASDGGREIALADAGRNVDRLRALRPVPWVPDRTPLAAALETFLAAHPDAEAGWITDGLETGGGRAFAERLTRALHGRLDVVEDSHVLHMLADARNEAGGLDVMALRTRADGPPGVTLRAFDLKGLAVGETNADFGGALETKARFSLPLELRNDIARIEIAGESAAGAVALLDDRAKRRRVGIVSGASVDTAQPLLAPNYYLSRALNPFAAVRESRPGTAEPIASLLDDNVNVLFLADVGVIAPAAADRLTRYVEDGGVVVRFAGTRLAGSQDDFTPVTLRRGGRILGGALSWETPKKLAPFDANSPFAGLRVPDEVTITRQVLADPEAGLPAKTWAHLVDGTPLVTAERRGKGLLVLFHVTADTTWSNLPLSGLFPDMLRKIVSLSGEVAKGVADEDADSVARAANDMLAPSRTLDGFGAIGTPPPTAQPISASQPAPAGPDHPPGFYGPPDASVAINTLADGERPPALDLAGLSLRRASLDAGAPIDLRGPLVVIALALFILDTLASLWLGGGLRGRRPAAAALVLLGLVGAFASSPVKPAWAAESPATSTAPSRRDIDAALATRLAYVVTGDAQTDEASRAGLVGLSRALALRTSLVPGDPVGVDPAKDELVFYPLLYWPIVASQPQPQANAVEKIGAFMKQGGTIIFDTRDALTSRPGGPPTPEQVWLRKLLAGVDVPELEPVPRDHVVTKTFYLIDGFVGRTMIGQTWIEALPLDPPEKTARPARAGDSVSPIVITSNDLAAAWATSRDGESLYPLVPGGARQRELALRGGINLVMYTLTGNYKADLVHVRDLLDRLGQ